MGAPGKVGESELVATWRLFWGQTAGRVVTVFFASAIAVYFFELGPEYLRAEFSAHIDRLVLPVVVAIIFFRTRMVESVEERRFWTLAMASFVIWLVGNSLFFVSTLIELPRWMDLVVDVCYVLLYLFFFLASDQQPQRPGGWSEKDVLYRFSMVGATVFITAMFAYFVAVPWTIQPQETFRYFASFNLYVVLDTMLAVKFGLLLLAARSPRWRRCFTLIALAALMMAAGDFVEGLSFAGYFEAVEGSRIDTIWLVPHFLFLLMTLTCTGQEARGEEWDEGSVAPVQSLLPFYAFALPLVHLGLCLTGYLDPAANSQREAIVFSGLVLFGILSIVQQVRLERTVLSLRTDLTVRALDEKLRQSQRLESIGRLAGGIAHDFNNLLMVITSYTQLARSDLATSKGEASGRLDEIDRAAERAADLIRQLLAFGRRQVLRPELVHVNEMVQGLEGMLALIVGDDVELNVELGDAVGFIRVDPSLMEQVIVNLVVNARDAMPRGGVLSIRTAGWSEERAGTGRDEDRDRWVELEVSDTGEGIDPKIRNQIFEPYFTTKEMDKGTGLGLATVYGIVEQSGGAIEVESEPGRGSVFSVRLPQAEGRRAAAVASPSAPIRVVRGRTILVAEDEPDIREPIAEYLEAFGLVVLQAEDGFDALEVAARHRGTIDVLVTDLVMPKMSGPKLASRLQEERADIKTIFVSGYTSEAVGEHGIIGEGTVFLQKPFLLEDLVETIRDVIEG
ncbi:MAG: ATP-binding protein [Thermoanaerobaculales bacterium]|nr:ATP-binding protein [Thermoanaerobaculales bacterium]